MTKVALASVGSLIDVTSAQTAINNNSNAIVAAVENTLSRDGTSPNGMGANLDMNGYQILNVGTTSYTVATLPTPSTGRQAVVTDGTASLAWGAAVTGGGSTTYLVWYNGSGWKVMGK